MRLTTEAEQWVDQQSGEIRDTLYDWLFDCILAGPPDETDLVVIEDDYRYRCTVQPGIEAEFIVLVHERRMLIKGFAERPPNVDH